MPRTTAPVTRPTSLLDRFLALPLAQKAAWLTALLSLGAMLILVLASHQGQRQLVARGSDLFGESLVQQLSRDASAPLVQGDKLSLQALLNELVSSPLIARGAIYDVENTPVAEAGKPADGLDFSASITFQDSIAGYVVVTFDTVPLQGQVSRMSWQLVGLSLLLAALVFVLALYPGRQLSAAVNDLRLLATLPPKRRRGNLHVAYRGDDELNALAEALLNPVDNDDAGEHAELAVLTVEITNLPSLQVNLGHQTLARHLQSLRQQLGTFCRLYDGELEASRSHCFSIVFNAGGDATGYVFRALCSAFLIEQGLSDSDLPFTIRQGIATNDSTLGKLEPVTGRQATIERSLLVASAVDEGIALSDGAAHHTSVEGRLLATSLGDGATRADRLEPAYQNLLERQLQTLGVA